MSCALLDINDCNVQLWHDQQHVQSPGYALLAGNNYRFGNEARAQARLQPRNINTRFWSQLNTHPLQPALGPARHTADLVHAHLLALHHAAGAPEEVFMAVPATFEREQLALLLGIIEQCPFKVVGLFNRSVALSLTTPQTGTDSLYHLEIQLHQAVLNELGSNTGERSLLASHNLPGCGLLALQEKLIEVVANTFIRQTRFDPRRKAASEQHLYNALPQALRELDKRSEVRIEVDGYSARIGSEALASANQFLFKAVHEQLAGQRANLLAQPLLGLLPGATEALPGLRILTPDSLIQTVANQQSQLRSEDALSLISHLPLPVTDNSDVPHHATAPSSPAPGTSADLQPTHLLQGFCARPLVVAGTPIGSDWQLYREGDNWQLRGPADINVSINGLPYAGQALRCGDSLALAGNLAGVLIEVC
ncbi:MAG: hypothetical protein ACK5ME_08775 [Parahaliea sp.]